MAKPAKPEPEPFTAPSGGGAQVTIASIDDLALDPANLRLHDERGMAGLGASLQRFGPARSIVVDAKGVVRAGNGTVEAARRAGVKDVLVVEPRPGQLVAVRRADWSPSEATAYSVADNRLTDISTFDDAALAETLRALQSESFDLAAVGFDDGEVAELVARLAADDGGSLDDGGGDATGEPDPAAARATLAERFGVPPFSVLDARQGYWQDRKRAWLALGIQSEIGRGTNVIGRSQSELDYMAGQGEYYQGANKHLGGV